MEIQNIVNFFMFNENLLWISNFVCFFSISHTPTYKKRKYSACFSFFIFMGKMENKCNKKMHVWKLSFAFQFKNEMKIEKIVNFDLCPYVEY